MLENGYGILPNKVLFDDTLKPNAKLVYVFVSSLCAEKGYCWASNQYIADQFKIASSTVSALVSELVNAGYLHIELDKNGGIVTGKHKVVYHLVRQGNCESWEVYQVG